MKKGVVFIICGLFSMGALGQNRNSIWCFGDSAGIDFRDTLNPVPIHSAVKSRGSCVSISDSTGQLLFYAYTRATIVGNTTLVKNRNNQLMQNGSNVVGEGWYQELCIIPMPGNSNQYYLFSIGVTGSSQQGLYYSIIDMSLNGGLGAVTLKNVNLQTYYADDCVQAIKHGNGRDWWVISRRGNTVTTNEFYEYLITPSGIGNPIIQMAGSATNNNLYRMTFSADGSKMACIDYRGLIEMFSFDRCTGIISYDNTIYSEPTSSADYLYLWSSAFSPNNRYLYISTSGDTTFLYQLDLQNPSPWNNRDTLWSYDSVSAAGGALKLAPDNKIYFACAWSDSVNFNYPYPNSVFNNVNNNLSVINYPDSSGTACNFQPFSFNLGGGRCYWGLPNNPDYEMPAISPCDTITTSISNQLSTDNYQLSIYPNPISSNSQITFTYPSSGGEREIVVNNINGKEMAQYALPQWSSVQKVKLPQMAKGIYVARLISNFQYPITNIKFVIN